MTAPTAPARTDAEPLAYAWGPTAAAKGAVGVAAKPWRATWWGAAPGGRRDYAQLDDETLEDATPTYLATTTRADAQVGAGPGRHFVGTVTTPADGGGGTSGTGGFPPGGGGGGAIP